MRPSAEVRNAGFTLVEALVAFAIAAILLGAIYDLFSTGMRASAGATRYSNAVLIAQSALESLTNIRLVPGKTSDRMGIFERDTTIQARTDLVREGGQVALMPFEVVVRVAWREGLRQRSVALSTIRLSPR